MRTAVVWLLELLALGIDGVVWGVAACTAYRSIAGAARHWVAPALLFGVVFVVWDHWVFGELVHWAGFPRGHREPLRLLEAGIQLGSTLVGFRAGEILVASIARGARAPGPGSRRDARDAAPHAGS